MHITGKHIVHCHHAHSLGMFAQDCIFLRGTECIVNDAKPLQCRTYPYWPELMDPEAWEAERSDVCEGIDHEEAPQIDIEQAALQLQASTEFFARRDGLL